MQTSLSVREVTPQNTTSAIQLTGISRDPMIDPNKNISHRPSPPHKEPKTMYVNPGAWCFQKHKRKMSTCCSTMMGFRGKLLHGILIHEFNFKSYLINPFINL